MRIDRIDPFQVEWSHHGTIALATESVGIQFLVLDVKEIYESGEVRFSRSPSPPMVDARVLTMAYGPMLTSSGGGSLLAVILSSGLFLLLDESPSEGVFCIYKSPAPAGYTSTCWSGDKALVSDDLGIIYSVDHHSFEFTQIAPPIPHSNTYVIHLVSNQYFTIATLDDNSCWKFNGDGWVNIVEPGNIKIISITLSSNDEFLLVQRCHDVLTIDLRTPGTHATNVVTLNSYLPGTLVPTSSSEFFVLHSNGKVSQSAPNLIAPTINGKVECTTRHPVLPLGAVVVGPEHEGWKYPILSTRIFNLALYPLDGGVEFCFKKAAFPISILAAKAKDFIPSTGTEIPHETSEGLASALLSPEFDAYRTKWIYSDQRALVLRDMRSRLHQIISGIRCNKKSTLDEVVLSWYGGSRSPPGKKKLTEKFLLTGDFVSETFSYKEFFRESETLQSEDGNEWKRCALTGLPLLSIDTRKSADGFFSAYKYSPTIEKEGKNPLIDLILSEATFCIFSGSLWT